MIGSFWNLCRACPSMPVDKLHSEYRSTYRWHEYTGPRQDVVRRPPQASGSSPPVATTSGTVVAAGSTSSRPVPNRADEDTVDGNLAAPRFEPALPRRKKHPELAYRTHEFLAMSNSLGFEHTTESNIIFDRARSEERGGKRVRTSRRSKSEGPRLDYRLQFWKVVASPPPRRPSKVLRSDSDPCDTNEDAQMFPWPRGRSGSSRRPAAGSATRTEEGRITAAVPRKSLSMGAIRSSGQGGPAAVHKRRNADNERGDDGAAELDSLMVIDTVDGHIVEELRGEEKIQNENLSKEDKSHRRKEFKTEYKKKFRPFSQYDYVEGKFLKKKDHESAQLPLLLHDMPQSDSWYREVLELRKKAGEYKHRGWGTELVPQHIAELYNKQMTLWEQVSRRSSLSALSLASTTPRAITKEEKEKENNKKSSPTKPFHRLAFSRSSTAPEKPVHDKKKDKVDDKDAKKDLSRSRKEHIVRHHLDRTTGSVDGALLASPIREKLEPVMPRAKEEELPKSPQKASPKSSPRTARSQSVGPGVSPKRQPRASSATPAPPKTAPAKTPPPALPTERRPRPSGGEDESDSEPEMEPETTSVIKSPPEPTRVKSPEQILMRSPEPVNWTVPLDTGKTFTVTQNVHQGDFTNRPHSEVKAWTPPAVPPQAPQSAPPQLPHDWKSPATDSPGSSVLDNPAAVTNGLDEKPAMPEGRSVTGTTLRCLEDPAEELGSGYHYPPTTESQGPYRVLEAPAPPLVSPSSARSVASDVLDKARTRFDNFWGKGKEDREGNV